MSALQLRYDATEDRLRASLQSASDGERVQVQRGKVALCIDRPRKRIISFEISDFRHFVNYHLLDELFGDDVVRGIAAFQSAVTATSRRSTELELPTPPRSSRRVLEELLRAA